jgi:2-methylcitrate dehydratase PrpD
VTLTAQLARLATRPLSHPERERLRALTLANLAAAIGKTHVIDRRFAVRRLPSSYRLALRLHTRTQDDFFPAGRVHVGAVTLGPILSMAERVKDRLFECLAAGYRVTCATSIAYSPIAQSRGFRPSGVFGPLGAAASAGMALQLDSEGLANAIGLSTAMSAGTNQSWVSGSDEWMLEVGASARAGVEAASFAANGVVASPVAIEGSAGWAYAYFNDSTARKLSAELVHRESRILQVAMKLYPVGGIAQVPTHLACRVHHRLAGALPDEVEICVSHPEAAYPGVSNIGPFKSRSDALVSVAYCVASGLTDGGIRLERPASGVDYERVMARIRLVGDKALKDTQAILRVRFERRWIELRGDGSALLKPTWTGMRNNLTQLADRCEANPGRVRLLADELGRPHPDARTLLRVLGT